MVQPWYMSKKHGTFWRSFNTMIHIEIPLLCHSAIKTVRCEESVFTCTWRWWCRTSQWRSAALDITVYRCFLSIAEAGNKKCPDAHLPPAVSMSPSSLPSLDRKTTHSLSITVSTDLSLWLELISIDNYTRKHMHACSTLAESHSACANRNQITYINT